MVGIKNLKPAAFTMSTLFPLSPPNAASEKLASIFADFRTTLETLPQPAAQSTATPPPAVPTAEIERLQGITTNLKEGLGTQVHSLVQYQPADFPIVTSVTETIDNSYMTETQAIFDKFAEDHRIATGEIGEMSIELMSAPLKDEEKERLDILRKELDLERQKFTDAAIKFGKEKATLEV